MKPVVVLIENDPASREAFSGELLALGLELHAHERVDLALRALRGSADLFLIDDHIPTETQPAGRRAEVSVVLCRQRCPDGLFVVYSSDFGASTRKAELARIGATEVLERSELVQKFSDLARMAASRRDKRLSAVAWSVPKTLAARAAVELIGESALKEGLRTTVGTGNLEISAMTGGFSGDQVLLVKRLALGSRPKEEWILKATQAAHGLEAEIAGATTEPKPWNIGLARWTPAPVEGWNFGASQFIPRTRPLRERLARGPSASVSERLARILWRDVLADRFAACEPCPPDRWPRTSARFVASATQALQLLRGELERAKAKPRILDLVSGVQSRLLGWEGKTWPFDHNTDQVCALHGDLHMRNVLLLGDQPFVIDWALATRGQRSLDVASLIVDMICLDFDGKPATSAQVSRALAGSTWLVAALSDSAGTATAVSETCGAFVEALVEEHRERGGSRGELASAVCFQAARYSRFTALGTTARLVLAFLLEALM